MSYAPARKGLVSARAAIRDAMRAEAAVFRALADRLERARAAGTFADVENVEGHLRLMAHGLEERARVDDAAEDEHG